MAPPKSMDHIPNVAMVTGASGFIGSHVVRLLLDQGVQVRALVRRGDSLHNLSGLDITLIEGDLLDRPSLERCIEGCDTLFHLAAVFAYWLEDPSVMYRVNIHGTTQLLEVALSAGVQKVVHTSSIAAIGATPGESLANETTLFNDWLNADHYVMSKYMADLEAMQFVNKGLRLCIVNPTFPFGDNDIAPTPTGYLVQRYVSGKSPVWLPGGLNAAYVRDIAYGHLLAAQKGRIGERYILGGHNLTYKEFGSRICDLAKVKAPRYELNPKWVSWVGRINEWMSDHITKREPLIVSKAIEYTGGKFLYFDLQKAQEQLGYRITPLETSLTESVEWFLRGRQKRLAQKEPVLGAANPGFKQSA